MSPNQNNRGFTSLKFLLGFAVLAILASIVILTLNLK